MASGAVAVQSDTAELGLTKIASFAGMRCLAWSGNVLYASRKYELLRAEIEQQKPIEWRIAGFYEPPAWRRASSKSRLCSRLFRDGFHALAVLPSGHLVAAVPNAIVTLAPGEREFRVSHRLLRGTRPLHVAAAPDGNIYWGEYFDNRNRDEVYIYGSSDRGATWDVTHVFRRGEIRHVHNIVYDRWGKCFWILTGDDNTECRVIRASLDFSNIETVLSGGQQMRAAAIVATKDGLFFSTDTPHELNRIYRLDRRGNLASVAEISSSSIYGCRAGEAIFFSTMAEPSSVNATKLVELYGSLDGANWKDMLHWEKDRGPMRYLQYGNAFLPDGDNESDLLAVSTIAVMGGDGELSLWRVRQ